MKKIKFLWSCCEAPLPSYYEEDDLALNGPFWQQKKDGFIDTIWSFCFSYPFQGPKTHNFFFASIYCPHIKYGIYIYIWHSNDVKNVEDMVHTLNELSLMWRGLGLENKVMGLIYCCIVSGKLEIYLWRSVPAVQERRRSFLGWVTQNRLKWS